MSLQELLADINSLSLESDLIVNRLKDDWQRLREAFYAEQRQQPQQGEQQGQQQQQQRRRSSRQTRGDQQREDDSIRDAFAVWAVSRVNHGFVDLVCRELHEAEINSSDSDLRRDLHSLTKLYGQSEHTIYRPKPCFNPTNALS